MPILHMETDSVRGVAQQLKANAGTIQAEYQALNGSVQTLTGAWQGSSADQFLQQAQALLTQIQQMNQQGDELANRLEREVAEWEQVAAALGGGAAGGLASAIDFARSNPKLDEPSFSTLPYPIDQDYLDSIGAGDAIPEPKVEIGEPLELLGHKDLPIPVYELNMDDLNSFDPAKAAAAIDTGGRPVMFMVHGWGNGEGTDGPDKAFRIATAQLNSQYGHLPESERPVVIGIEWESGMGPESDKMEWDWNYSWHGKLPEINPEFDSEIIRDYDKAHFHASSVGNRFGQFLAEFNTHNPETSVNVMAHSMGVRMVMEGLESNQNAVVDNMLAIQGAVDVDKFKAGGDYYDVLNDGRVGNFGATYSKNSIWDLGDRAMLAREAIGYGDSLGSHADELNNIELFDLSDGDASMKDNRWNKFSGVGREDNHRGLDAQELYPEVIPDFYSSDEGNFQQTVERVNPQDSIVDFDTNQAYA